MTAQVEEVEGAIAEGCDIVPLMAPVRVEKDENNQAIALVVQPQIPGEYDRGRPKPDVYKRQVNIHVKAVVAEVW